MQHQWGAESLPLSSTDLATLERANEAMQASRLGDLVVRVVDENGLPLAGVPVHYAQRQHSFRFGLHYPHHPRALDLFQDAGLNSITLWLGWKYVQPERGFFNFEYLDRVWNPSALHQRGLRIKAHAVNWFKPEWHVLPQYLLETPLAELPLLVYDHVSQIMRHWGSYIDTFEIVNEPFWLEANALPLSLEDMVRICSASALAVRDAHSQTRLEVNFTDVARVTGYLVQPGELIEALDKAGVPFGTIGLQILDNAYTSTTPTVFYRPKTIAGLYQSLRRYCNLGRSVAISGLSVPSAPPPVKPPSSFKPPYGPWDETRQAHYLDALYTLFFSQGEVEEISWSHPVDGRLSLIPGGGLLGADLAPKPSYHALCQWIIRHTSSGHGVSDASGKANIRAYAGEYELTVGSGALGRRSVSMIEPRTVLEHTVVLGYNTPA